MQQPTLLESDNIYEVRFKNTRKAFFRNVNAIPLITGDYVVVESDRGYDVGQISLGGILARLQMRKRKVRNEPERVRKIYRRASREDVEKLLKAREREQLTLVRTREIIRDLDLEMKLSDVEYQGDITKAIFYYIADTRVDFRELIKRLANEFKVRVEMKQIGLRHESGLVGGIGSCGRELCCTTWLTDFKTVSTAAARYQNLSLNPMKISGQCGRLKCCLNFELEAYMDALRDIPKVERIETEMGMAYLQKTDIFKRTMWYSYQGDTTWIAVTVDKVKLLHEMNQNGVKPSSLQAFDVASPDDPEKPMDFVDVVGQAVLREDPKRKKKKKKKPGAQGSGEGQQPRQERRSEPRTEGGEGGNAEGQAQQPRSRDQQRRGGDSRSQGRNRNERRPDNRGGQQGQQGGQGGEGGGERRQQRDGRDRNRNRGGEGRPDNRGGEGRQENRGGNPGGEGRQENRGGEGRPDNRGENRNRPKGEGGGKPRRDNRQPRDRKPGNDNPPPPPAP